MRGEWGKSKNSAVDSTALSGSSLASVNEKTTTAHELTQMFTHSFTCPFFVSCVCLPHSVTLFLNGSSWMFRWNPIKFDISICVYVLSNYNFSVIYANMCTKCVCVCVCKCTFHVSMWPSSLSGHFGIYVPFVGLLLFFPLFLLLLFHFLFKNMCTHL